MLLTGLLVSSDLPSIFKSSRYFLRILKSPVLSAVEPTMEERTECGKYAHKCDVSLNLIDAQEYRGLDSVPKLQSSFAPMLIDYLAVCMCVLCTRICICIIQTLHCICYAHYITLIQTRLQNFYAWWLPIYCTALSSAVIATQNMLKKYSWSLPEPFI
jgi:hypothetical protein